MMYTGVFFFLPLCEVTLVPLALSLSSTQMYLSLLALTPRLSPPLPPLVSAVSLTPWA